MPPPEYAIDIGHAHFITYSAWEPDRDLNPQFAELAWEEKAGVTIWHPRKDNGEPCCGHVSFDTPGMCATMPSRAVWHVVSWEPLTIEPSVLCACGDHGFIRSGRWEPA